MIENPRMDDPKMEIAMFRYGVISELVNGQTLCRKKRNRLIAKKSTCKWKIPGSCKTSIGKSSIRRWIRIYNENGQKVEALCPKGRSDQGRSRAMDEDTCGALITVRQEMPEATIDAIIEEMITRELVTPGITLNPSTVYRYLDYHGLMERTCHTPKDRRKFEAELPNDLWQSDVMHGPHVEYKGKQRKTYLIAIIDDHSRLVVHARFYLSENLKKLLTALEDAFAKRGLPRKLYVDNGAAFRSKLLEYITAWLNITLIHAKPYQPQGKGKIERFFKTVRSSFLPRHEVKTLAELNAALDCWLQESYHQKKHGATGQTPFKRFTANTACLRMAPDNLSDYFRTVARRKVAKDRSLTLNGKIYEAPVVLIGKQVELLYHDDTPTQVEIRYQNKSFGLARPVDIHLNSRVKRDKNNNPQIDSESKTRKSGRLF
jgi:putative transposase